MKTETFCWASGAMTDLAILVTPTACELLEALPLETTLSGSQMEFSTCKCSEGWSSGGGGLYFRHFSYHYNNLLHRALHHGKCRMLFKHITGELAL